MTTDDLARLRAIGFIQECRDIHEDYARWQEATPDWRDQCIPDENTGGPEHHRECVAKYDEVIALLDWIDELEGAEDD